MKQLTLAALGFVFGITLVRADEIKQPSLHATLLHTTEVQTFLAAAEKKSATYHLLDNLSMTFWLNRNYAQANDAKINGPSVTGAQEFCKALGLGCLVIDYTDDISKISLYALYRANFELDGQIFPHGIARVLDHVPLKWGGPQYSDSIFPNGNVMALAKNSILNSEKLKADDTEALRKNWNHLKQLTQDPSQLHEFELFFAEHPRLLRLLPALFQKSLAADQKNAVPSGLSTFLEQTIAHTLLLVDDVFSRSVDSRSLTYPYMSDSISPKGSLLLAGQTVVDLMKLGRMPQIRQLTGAIRAEYSQIDPLFLEKTGGGYLAEALYDPQENILYLDLTEPFFENAYTLYHELDHVRVFHSGVVEKFGNEIRQLLNLPDTAESKELLKNAILRDYATLELLAIDNSARLYRSTGQLVYQLGDNPSSAKAWHDSYFGSTNEMNLYMPLQSRTMLPGVPDVKVDLGRPVTILQYFTLADHIQDEIRAKKRRDAEKDYRRKEVRVALDFDGFLKSRQLVHLENYRKRYLSEAPQFQPEQLELAHNELKQPVKIPEPQILTCAEVRRIGAALGAYARYGLPFPYRIDKGWESCSAQPGALNFKGGPLSVRAGLPNLRGPSKK